MPFPYSGRDTPLPKIDLSDEHLKAIGRTAVEWSRMEFVVESTVWKLANLDLDFERWRDGKDEALGPAITAHLRLDLWLGQILSLSNAILSDKTLLDRVLELVRMTRTLQIDRHIIIHARWKRWDENNYAIKQVKARERIEKKYITPSLDDLKDLCMKTEELANDWAKLQYDLIVPLSSYHARA